MLDGTHSQVDVETELCDNTASDVFYFSFDKMIFSICKVSRDGKRFITASVRHFTLCGIL